MWPVYLSLLAFGLAFVWSSFLPFRLSFGLAFALAFICFPRPRPAHSAPEDPFPVALRFTFSFLNSVHLHGNWTIILKPNGVTGRFNTWSLTQALATRSPIQNCSFCFPFGWLTPTDESRRQEMFGMGHRYCRLLRAASPAARSSECIPMQVCFCWRLEMSPMLGPRPASMTWKLRTVSYPFVSHRRCNMKEVVLLLSPLDLLPLLDDSDRQNKIHL